MAGRRDSFDLSVSGPIRSSSDSVHTTSGSISSGSIGSNSACSFNSLTFDLNKYTKFERYYSIRDCAAAWLAKPENTALFTGRETHLYLAQMAATMQMLEIVLAIPHQPIRCPGAAPGPSPAWPGISKHEVFCQFDQLIKGDRSIDTKAMPWNRRDNTALSD